MKDSRRVCYTCGKKYHYCAHCPEYKNMPDWMNITCCEECHDLYKICANFNLGKCSKEEAQELLSKYDLTQINISRPNMIHTLQKIYDQDTVEAEVPVVMAAPVIEEVVPENNDEEVNVAGITEVSEETEEKVQPKPRKRKKPHKVSNELGE